MATGPENRFIKRINDKLPKEVYREKMANPYRGGTPDLYYESTGPALWVEYKFWSSVPRLIQMPEIVSPLQWLWLERAHNNGVQVAIIVGYKKGGWIFRVGDQPITGKAQKQEDLLSARDLADCIRTKTSNESKSVRNQKCVVSSSNRN